MPVYILPQSKIVSVADSDDGKTLDETNLEISKQNALIFAQSLIIFHNCKRQL